MVFCLEIIENGPKVMGAAGFLTLAGIHLNCNYIMQHFKLGFRNRSGPEQMEICDKHLAAFASLPADQRPDLDLVGLQATVAAAHESHRRIQQLKADLKHAVAAHRTRLRAAREAMTLACLTMVAQVKFEPQGMMAAGLQLQKPWRKVGVPAAPLNLTARATANAGEIRLDWKRTVRRCLFQVEVNADPRNEAGWKPLGGNRQQHWVATDLVSGSECYFRVRAVNIHGNSPWSGIATARVK